MLFIMSSCGLNDVFETDSPQIALTTSPPTTIPSRTVTPISTTSLTPEKSSSPSPTIFQRSEISINELPNIVINVEINGG